MITQEIAKYTIGNCESCSNWQPVDAECLYGECGMMKEIYNVSETWNTFGCIYWRQEVPKGDKMKLQNPFVT